MKGVWSLLSERGWLYAAGSTCVIERGLIERSQVERGLVVLIFMLTASGPRVPCAGPPQQGAPLRPGACVGRSLLL